MLTDDGNSAVGLPEVPLLAVLPGTGGLTRVTDKRKLRRDRADIFCSMEEGVKGPRARDRGLVDELVPNAQFDEVVMERARICRPSGQARRRPWYRPRPDRARCRRRWLPGL